MKYWLSMAFLAVTVLVGAQTTINEAQLKALLGHDKTVILDVRTVEEFAAGHLAGSRLLPYDRIDARSAAQVIPTRDTTVVVYCRSGRRSTLAAQTLKALGYTNVRDFGGLTNWRGPLVTAK